MANGVYLYAATTTGYDEQAFRSEVRKLASAQVKGGRERTSLGAKGLGALGFCPVAARISCCYTV